MFPQVIILMMSLDYNKCKKTLLKVVFFSFYNIAYIRIIVLAIARLNAAFSDNLLFLMGHILVHVLSN